MKPLNYLRAATAELRGLWIPKAKKYTPKDAAACEEVLSVAAAATKFVLPTGGRILSNELGGLPPKLRLPFPSVLIEYEAKEGNGAVEQHYGNRGLKAKKRIVVARQHGEHISVHAICHFTGKWHGLHGDWRMMPYYAVLCRPEHAHELMNAPPVLPETNGKAINDVVMAIAPTGEIAELADDPEFGKKASLNMADEMMAVLELIEALSCANVNHEPIQQKKISNGSMKHGAIPFDEYRVLVINAGGKNQRDTRQVAGTHRSPREHLRRGHIRRLDGERQVWVNSTIVNPGTKGRITKTYELRA